ncbi:MAG TPA: hypothetical protein VF138_07010 [Caulobacteraceae bacterium]
MRFTLALAGLCALTAAFAPAPTPASSTAVQVSAPPMSAIVLAQNEPNPEDMGACIHRVSSLAMCNEITRRYCFGGGFAYATFYEGITCSEAKDNGYY